MTRDPLAAINTRVTPQTQPADARQARNNAGGYSFSVTPIQQVRRFLINGVAGGTYYVKAPELALENAQVVLGMTMTPATHRQLVDVIVEVSDAGRAPRQRPALFALAVAASNGADDGRRYALDQLPRVARTGTHLFQFVTYAQQFRGWGRQLRRAVGAWYLGQDVDDLAFQAVKYRQREGWTHRDLLRKSHPQRPPGDVTRGTLFDWIVGRTPAEFELGISLVADDPLRFVEGYERARRVTGGREAAELVTEYGLPWEALPDEVINQAVVWEALLERGLPATALIRHLPRLTRLGLLSPLGTWAPRVAAQLTDVAYLRRGRVHPLNLLVAQRTYASGRSDRGSSTWTPSRPVVDALDASFYASFGAVTPTGRRIVVALDVSGSMTTSRIADTPLTPREASAALALVTANVEDRYELLAFTGRGSVHGYYRNYHETPGVAPLAISPRERLDDVISHVNGLTFGRTDCALPMLYALEHQLEVDAFVIYTDNESWAGSIHPHEALRRYRERTGIPARLVVVGMTATQWTVADPSDVGSLDVAGFDTATPELISNFVRGDL